MHEIGTGVLCWEMGERRSDRYGYVFLDSSPENHLRVDLTREMGGKHGELVAVVRETRKSEHVGDLFHSVHAQTPKTGETITLGVGTLSFRGYNTVGIIPTDDRRTLWLDINTLYKAHAQTVTLFFKETPVHCEKKAC